MIGDIEARDLKASGGKTTRFRLTEMSFKRLVAAGVTEVFGSGAYTVGHGVQAFQFAYYVKWGMTPAQALQMATSYRRREPELRPGQASRAAWKTASMPTWSPSPAIRSPTSPKCSA